MQIEINKNTTLLEINTSFRKEFPYLNLAFFMKEHEAGAPSNKTNQLPLDTTFQDAGDPHRIGLLDISPDQTVAFTEKEFEDGFGLHVQILRKSKDIWLQTTTSDRYSLAELNAQAKEADSFRNDAQEPGDYHEQL